MSSIFSRYVFELNPQTQDFKIVDKFKRKSPLSIDGDYADLCILGDIGPNVLILYANHLDNIHLGDLYVFNAKNHTLDLLQRDCQDKINYSKKQEKVIKFSSKIADGTPVYMFITEDGRFESTFDKERSNRLSKLTTTTTDLHTFYSGRILRQNVCQDAFGYQHTVYEVLDQHTGEKQYIGTCDTPATIKHDQDGKPILRFQDDERKYCCRFSDEGIAFTLQQKLEPEQSNRSILHQDFNYCLVLEDLDIDGEQMYNLYMLNYDYCTEETYLKLFEYFNEDNEEALSQAIQDDESLTPIGEGLVERPHIKYCKDGTSIDVHYLTDEHTCTTRISHNGTPYTITKDNPYQA